MAARTPTAIAALAGVRKRVLTWPHAPAERQVPVPAHREHHPGRGALDRQRAHEDRRQDDEEVDLADRDAADELGVEVRRDGRRDRELAGQAVGHGRRDVLERQDDRQQEDHPDRRPRCSTDDSTPRGAWRLASIVSSPNVPAVSKPYRMKIDMKMPSAKVANMLPFCGRLAHRTSGSARRATGGWRRTAGCSAKTSIPRISVATPMLLSDRQRAGRRRR